MRFLCVLLQMLSARALADANSEPLSSLLSSWHDDLTEGLGLRSASFRPRLEALLRNSRPPFSACPVSPLLGCVRNRNTVALSLLIARLTDAGDLERCLATPDPTGAVLLHHVLRSPAPGVIRVMSRLRHGNATAGVVDALGFALGFARGFPPWPSDGIVRRADVEAAAGTVLEEALAPALLRLPPPILDRALNTEDARGWTPLDLACSRGAASPIAWLLAAGARSGAGSGGCAALLAAGGHTAVTRELWPHVVHQDDELNTCDNDAAAAAAVALGASTPPRPFSVPPPTWDVNLHAAAGWRSLPPDEWSALLGPPVVATRVTEEGRARVVSGCTCSIPELPLSALLPQNRDALRRHYLSGSKPFFIRGSGGTESVVSTEALIALFEGGDEQQLLTFGGTPYAAEYGHGSGVTTARAFINDFMGDAKANGSYPPLVFDNSVLDNPQSSVSVLRAAFARRVAAIFPQPTTLSQFIMGPPLAGSSLHFHPSAVNILLIGLKAWSMIPPAEAGFHDGHVGQWWERRGESTRCRYEALQGPHDLMFIPDGWGHAVLNLADSVAIALEFAGE